MRPARAAAAALLAVALAPPARAADETPATSKIVAVDLFKNGLAIVRREATLGKAGVYVLDDVPQAVHGTYWVESTSPVETLVRMRDVEVPADEAAPGNLQDDLAGKKVTVHFRGDKRAPVVGTVVKLKPPKPDDAVGGAAPQRLLVIQTSRGRSYIEPTEVGEIETEADAGKVVRKKPRLLLTVGKTDQPETKVVIRYLTHGLGWAASYKIDIADPKTLALEQHAVIKNELADLDADVRLISGFPSVQFAHVRSPLAAHTTWAGFFQQLSHSATRNPDVFSNGVVSQQVIANNYRGGLDYPGLGAIPTGEGVDLHYQPIGKRALAEGDALAFTVAKGKADYERIVEWLVPDTRDEHGREGGRERNRYDEDDDAWDALKFKNPLPFPMTTGPATVTAGGAFNGQRTSFWVNAGEETVLRVNKALSVRTRAVEHEQPLKNGGDRNDAVWVGGRQYRRSTVEGELTVSNHRKEAISTVLRRRFSGDLVSSDGTPKSSLREEGVYSVNKRNELVWTFPLKAGEERKVKYTYTVLVPY